MNIKEPNNPANLQVEPLRVALLDLAGHLSNEYERYAYNKALDSFAWFNRYPALLSLGGMANLPRVKAGAVGVNLIPAVLFYAKVDAARSAIVWQKDGQPWRYPGGQFCDTVSGRVTKVHVSLDNITLRPTSHPKTV